MPYCSRCGTFYAGTGTFCSNRCKLYAGIGVCKRSGCHRPTGTSGPNDYCCIQCQENDLLQQIQQNRSASNQAVPQGRLSVTFRVPVQVTPYGYVQAAQTYVQVPQSYVQAPRPYHECDRSGCSNLTTKKRFCSKACKSFGQIIPPYMPPGRFYW